MFRYHGELLARGRVLNMPRAEAAEMAALRMVSYVTTDAKPEGPPRQAATAVGTCARESSCGGCAGRPQTACATRPGRARARARARRDAAGRAMAVAR